MSGEDDLIIGTVVADQAAAEAAEAARQSRRKRRTAFPSPTEDGVCSNCGTTLQGPVCHSCGQSADEFHRPVWQLFGEVVDGLLGLEGRLWRTLPPLMLKPGEITRKYLSGVRMRYVQPFRLYLFASVIFFLFAFLGEQAFNFGGLDAADEAAIEEVQENMRQGLADALTELESEGVPPAAREAARLGIERGAAGLEALRQQAEGAQELTPAEREALRRAEQEEWLFAMRCELVPEDMTGCPQPAPEGEAALDQMAEALGPTINIEGLEDAPLEVRRFFADRIELFLRDPAALVEEMQARAPQVMFFLLPIYALLLAFTHIYKRGYFFYDHLVVSLHFHAFLFLALLLLMGASALIGAGWTTLIFLLWSNFYLYRIHRRVYAHGRFSSLLRTLFMDFVYLIVVALALVLGLIAVFLLAGG